MERIVVDPRILGGKPIIKGTRIAVSFILDLLASGMTPAEIVAEYPQLTEKDVLTATRYAAFLLQKEYVILKKAS
ncbi:MAG: DUF433 domain-containing protein [Elusimicrobia bacterium]|nr:DUF433 domain-containing protein [Elusimicrobiota bacterium]